MRILIAIAALGVAVMCDRAATAQSSLSPETRKMIEEAQRDSRDTLNGEVGERARVICKNKLGIKENVRTGMDVVTLGYGAAKAAAYTECVVDILFPVK